LERSALKKILISFWKREYTPKSGKERLDHRRLILYPTNMHAFFFSRSFLLKVFLASLYGALKLDFNTFFYKHKYKQN
jgi:hypothetical protein